MVQPHTMQEQPTDSSQGILPPYPPLASPGTGESAVAHLARLAAQLVAAPAALIALPGLGRTLEIYTPTRAGTPFPWDNFSNAQTICDYIRRSGEPLLISDLRGPGAREAPDHEGRAVAYAGVPITFASGESVGALCVMDRRTRDWTLAETCLLEEIAGVAAAIPRLNVLEMDTRLRQSLELEAVGRLAGGIAHDFNNILTAIRGHADLLLDEVASADPRRMDLEEIRRSTDRAALLTQQLLAFSRRQIMQPRPLDLARLVPSWVEPLRHELGSSIEVRVEIEPDVAMVTADPAQIETAIASIIANSKEATPPGGTITISLSNTTLDEAFARTFPYRVEPGAYVRIAITDDGHGMDEHTLERIFEPFFTTRDAVQGAGLGLSTVYGIVKQSGGYVWATSAPGEGTTIEILLPSHEQGASQQVPETLPETAHKLGTILLVEDEAVVRSLAVRILGKAGYEVLEAQSGADALRIAREHPATIHLLLTDLTMPGMGGSELARHVAEIRPDIRTLFISGYTEDLDFRRASIRSGSFLEKPFTPDELAAKVREVLGAQ